METHGDPPSLSVNCDDIMHVTDTRYNGKYQWCCSLVDPRTAKPLQTGTMPNYNRYKSTSSALLLQSMVCALLMQPAACKDTDRGALTWMFFLLRAQQLLLVRLRKMALEQKDLKKKVFSSNMNSRLNSPLITVTDTLVT